MFELTAPTRLKVRNVSPRKEVHGEELVQAIDVDLEWTTSNEFLYMFDLWMHTAFYMRSGETEAQADVPGVPTIAPNLRLPALEMPIKWSLELLGRDFRVSHGLGGKSDLVLSTAKVKKFRFTFKEGGTVIVGFQVQCNTDVGEKIVGKLCALEGEEIEATLMGSDPADDKPLNTAGAGEGPWPFPPNDKPDATSVFLSAQGASPEGAAG